MLFLSHSILEKNKCRIKVKITIPYFLDLFFILGVEYRSVLDPFRCFFTQKLRRKKDFFEIDSKIPDQGEDNAQDHSNTDLGRF